MGQLKAYVEDWLMEGGYELGYDWEFLPEMTDFDKINKDKIKAQDYKRVNEGETKMEENMVIEENKSDFNPSDWKSDKIDKLASSLAKAQSEIEGAKNNSTNPFYKSSYADLHTVIASAMPSLTKYGLSVIQGNRFCDKTNGFYITTMLLHESGQWVRSEVRMPLGQKKDAQAVGGACTYGRRYGLSAMVGIAQYDDDANSISKK